MYDTDFFLRSQQLSASLPYSNLVPTNRDKHTKKCFFFIGEKRNKKEIRRNKRMQIPPLNFSSCFSWASFFFFHAVFPIFSLFFCSLRPTQAKYFFSGRFFPSVYLGGARKNKMPCSSFCCCCISSETLRICFFSLSFQT